MGCNTEEGGTNLAWSQEYSGEFLWPQQLGGKDKAGVQSHPQQYGELEASLSYMELWQRKYRAEWRGRKEGMDRERGEREGRERKVLEKQFNYHKSFKGWTRPMKHKYHQELS